MLLERWETNKICLRFPQLMAWKQFPCCRTKWWSQTEPSGLPELRKKRLKFGKTKVARIFQGKLWKKKELQRESENSEDCQRRAFKSLVKCRLVNIWKENICLRPGRESPGSSRRKDSLSSHRVGKSLWHLGHWTPSSESIVLVGGLLVWTSALGWKLL